MTKITFAGTDSTCKIALTEDLQQPLIQSQSLLLWDQSGNTGQTTGEEQSLSEKKSAKKKGGGIRLTDNYISDPLRGESEILNLHFTTFKGHISFFFTAIITVHDCTKSIKP